MSSSNKSKIISGLILILVAAFFSISLLLQVLNFGYQTNNFIYITGKMLFTVYGFSSIFIPLLLFVCGMVCLISKWTMKKIFRLVTVIIPFLTMVLTENICKSILSVDNSSLTFFKVAITVITGLMLVAIEYLGVGIIVDKIYFKHLKEKAKETEVETEIPESNEDESSEEFVEQQQEDKQEESIFDEALAKVRIDEEIKIDETAEEPVKSEVQNRLEEKKEEVLVEDVAPVEKAESEEIKVVSNPATMITKEEYAALMPQIDEEETETLEWPNLPVPPENLPPEYDEEYKPEEIDENDPTLQFPPIEDENKVVEENKKDDVYSAFDIDMKVDSEKVEESPYDAAKKIEEYANQSKNETVFSKQISLEDENPQEVEEKKEVAESKFPSKIVLDDVESEMLPEEKNQIDVEEEQTVKADESTEEFVEESQIESKPETVEEINLGDIPTDKIEDNDLENIDDVIFEQEPEINSEESEKTLDPDFFDIDLNEDEDNDELSGNIPEVPNELKVDDTIFNQIEKQENSNFELPKTTAFSDMENDIKQDQDLYFKENPIINNELIESEAKTPDVSDLTADQLNDFFNAQQEENVPKTKEIQGNLPEGNRAQKKGPYIIPSDLLTAYKDDQYWIIDNDTKEASLRLKQTLSEFNIEADIIGIKKGPVVTMFELSPAPGVKLSKIVALQDNIALSLAASSVRIVAPIPGKQAVGIEVPNKERSIVSFRELIELDLPEFQKMSVPVILGKDILGKAQLIDLVKTPHMLIAGSTGSGKSVCVNSIILSILYKRSYKEVKLILIDPKVVELKLYNNIPHLLTPVITEPKKAFQALQYCLCEMERRYALLDGLGVRDISNYNKRIEERKICTEKLPYIVVIIDEFADLMATTGKELESIVARLAAMSRAVGIHLVLATQRPSVNVITGLIKANIPTRIAFMVASKTDSHIIIDGIGAEKLLGKGDMLYASAVDPFPVRIQGTFVSDQEVENVVQYVKQFGEPDYIDDEIFVEDEEENVDLFGNSYEEDPLYDQALDIVVQAGKASASYIQRRLKIGYNRAARLVEEMEERGIVGPANGSKPREIIHIP